MAVKMMRHHFSMQPEFMRNFQNEAKIIAGLNHENIIRVFDIESRFKTVFIIYEFLEGESLADLILRLKRIPPHLALTYLCQMASALAYAAEKGLVHRDINPSNVIVLQNDRIKLIDFGLAGPIGTNDFQTDGNFHYLAPELIDGEPADFRTDIFSLGLTAFHMVSSQLPVLSENPAERMKMMQTRTIPDPGKQVEDLPEILRQFILTACSRDPDQRFQTPKQAQAFLFNGTPAKKTHPALPGKVLTRTLTFEIGPGREEEFSRLIHELDQRLPGSDTRDRGDPA